MGNKKPVIQPAVQCGIPAMELEELKIGADFRDECGKRVGQNRVHSEDQEWRGPGARGTHVDNPIADSEGEHRETAGEKHKGAGPQILINRKKRMEQSAYDKQRKPR